MKHFFSKFHYRIDVVSIYICIYCIMINILIRVFYFVKNELICALLVLGIPLLLIRLKYIIKINDLLHRLFGFRR